MASISLKSEYLSNLKKKKKRIMILMHIFCEVLIICSLNSTFRKDDTITVYIFQIGKLRQSACLNHPVGM